MELREATPDDHDGVRELCAAIWPDRDVEYLDRVYPEWLEGPDRRSLVATADDRLVGIAQCVLLTEREAWLQGMRVHPEVRGEGVSAGLVDRLADWARGHGALVARNLVYSWNGAGMGLSRAIGFRAVTSFRWARPEPVEEPDPPGLERSPAVAWQAWTDSEARDRMGGLAMDRAESWALRECTPAQIRSAGQEDGAIAIVDGGLRAMAYRGRAYEEPDGEATGIEYAAAAWRDVAGAESLFRAIAADGARMGVDEVRVPVPETPRFVSDAARCRVPIDEEPHFVFALDLPA